MRQNECTEPMLQEILDRLQQNITREQYEEKLKQQKKEIKEKYTSALVKQKFFYEKVLWDTDRKLTNLQQSYDKTIQQFAEIYAELESLKQQPDISVRWIQQAEAGLLTGDTQVVDAIFKQIQEQAEQGIQTSQQGAAAHYRRGIIAEDALRYKEAYDHFMQAVHWQPEHAHYLYAAGSMAFKIGQYQQSIANNIPLLRHYLEQEGAYAPEVAMLYNQLGSAWGRLDKYRKAIRYYKQAIDSGLKIYGEGHPHVATYRNNLGVAWRSLRKYRKAIGYYEQALASNLKTYGEDHPDVAIGRNNLGEVWRCLRKYDKAIGYHEQALASDLKTYGEDHPAVAIDRNHLGAAWRGLGECDKAMGYFKQALASDLKTYGEGHPVIAIDRENLFQETGFY